MQEKNKNLYGIILAGGSGKRLWPMSTQLRAKQFLDIGTSQSLIRLTYERMLHFCVSENIYVVCGVAHAAQVASHLPELASTQIIVEPEAKNTAAAIALAAVHLNRRDPNALMAIMPADHAIPDTERSALADHIRLGTSIAREHGVLVTLGVVPDTASTGYGYIERGQEQRVGNAVYYKVKSFREKPDSQTASRYLDSGSYYWNSGMFVWQVQTFLSELKKFKPSMAATFEKITQCLEDPSEIAKLFATLESTSVDYAVMEHSEKVVTISARFHWDDVGSMASFEKLIPKDASANCIQGECFTLDASGNVVISEGKPVVLIGVADLIVIQTDTAVLVLPKDRAEDVKKMVENLEKVGRQDLL